MLLAGVTWGVLAVDDAQWLSGAVPAPIGRFAGLALAGRSWRRHARSAIGPAGTGGPDPAPDVDPLSAGGGH